LGFTKEDKIERDELFSRGLKKCSKCNRIKQTSEFHKSNKEFNNLRSVCKECRSTHIHIPIIDLPNEIWKDIRGYKGLYQISNMGRIKNLNYQRSGKEQLMKLRMDKKNYLYINLYRENNDIVRSFQVHRLVLITFVGNCPENFECDHLDRNPSNNKLENLKWKTKIDNLKNMGAHKDSTSKFKGVCWDTSRKKWLTTISIAKKQYHLGRFNNEIRAAKAYDAIAKENGFTTNKMLGLLKGV